MLECAWRRGGDGSPRNSFPSVEFGHHLPSLRRRMRLGGGARWLARPAPGRLPGVPTGSWPGRGLGVRRERGAGTQGYGRPRIRSRASHRIASTSANSCSRSGSSSQASNSSIDCVLGAEPVMTVPSAAAFRRRSPGARRRARWRSCAAWPFPRSESSAGVRRRHSRHGPGRYRSCRPGTVGG